MSLRAFHRERHLIQRVGWLRAAVLGANDGIVSTASILVGVSSAPSDRVQVLVAGVAALVAGAMSMAAGEYVSVSSQADTERADLERETKELRDDPEGELRELAAIYETRGVDPVLSREVAAQMMGRDALAAHARDELGITEISTARPLQAAMASALTFAAGAALPLLAAIASPLAWTREVVAVTSLLALALLGGLSAYAGGASAGKPTVRVVVWGALAMLATAAVGALFGVVA